ncbi:MAG: hypothetical protein DRJ33_07895 [Candidatus Methanomethylicota archaeon]|uniref:PIN domain-containing protein n=1 Tax=Thermoproteota archaeon TaxID=2056631 RepID=A0A497ER34_9CREN|nr:MAG: hypothetical protein DRJ33_07895 [Candidatus Verstraetearchaeota archaeon]
MALLDLDCDALIILAKISLMQKVAERFECVISEDVYEEVVVEGKRKGYSDALTVEELVKRGLIKVLPVTPDRRALDITTGLGKGERTTLSLFFNVEADFVVTDDTRFLSRLIRAGVNHLDSATVIVLMFKLGFLTKSEALRALTSLRPLIKTDAFMKALKSIKG